MTQEEKELLLKDLCARLPYKPKVHVEHDVFYDEREPYDTELNLSVLYNRCAGMEIKPYLRPMSSMTEDEMASYLDTITGDDKSNLDEVVNLIDWLNQLHFDYHGLIEKGLALEAHEGMY